MSENLHQAAPGASHGADPWHSNVACLCEAGPEGEILRLSPGLAAVLSGPARVSVPNRLFDLIHPDDRESFSSEFNALFENGSSLEKRPVKILSADGRTVSMEVSAEKLGNNGKPSGVLLWLTDTGQGGGSWETDTVDRFFGQLTNFTSHLFDPLVLLDTQARIVHVNDSLKELLGYGGAELRGAPFGILLDERPGRIKQSMLRFAKWMRTGRMRDVSCTFHGKAGKKIPVTLSGTVMRSEGGELTGMVVVARDERKNALLADLEKKNSELARANEDLKKLDSMKDDILSLVGHELRAPLANILGYAEFLKEWELGEGERDRFVGIIYQESQRLSRLVNDILDLTRMEAGRMSYLYVTDSINRVVRAAVDSLSADIENKKLMLVLSLDDRIGPSEFDPDRIQQVVTNMIHNAIKFSEPGKTLAVGTDPKPGGAVVFVRDQGPGIDLEDGHKVFQKFEQIDEVSHHAEGAGLGMPIAKQIIEEGHGGSLWFESDGRGTGAVFKFMLPERRPE